MNKSGLAASKSPAGKFWLIGGIVLVAFAILVILAQFLPQSPLAAEPAEEPASDTAQEPAAQEATELPIVKRDATDPMAIGDVDAPVVLVMWTDMRCPFCAIFNRDTLPTLIEDYVDTGQVRIEVHDVAFFGEQSEDAAVAAHAAAEQGKFFEYLQAVYAAAPDNGHPDLPRDLLISFAEEAGVPDLEQFTADLDRAELREAVQQDTKDAQELGVNSVPFFVAGHTALAGAQPVETFQQLLDQELAK